MSVVEIPDTLQVGPIQIDHPSRSVYVGGDVVFLTRKEYQLLRFMAADPERVFTHRELLASVWDSGYAETASRTLESHVSRVRVKLAAAGAPGLVRNVWSVGYALTTPGQFAEAA